MAPPGNNAGLVRMTDTEFEAIMIRLTHDPAHDSQVNVIGYAARM